jgi:hypothetical protein
VLGLVGAGGIGMAIETAMNLFQWDRVALMLFAIFAVVIVAEVVVTYIRKKIIQVALNRTPCAGLTPCVRTDAPDRRSTRGAYTRAHFFLPNAASRIALLNSAVGVHRPPWTMKRLVASTTVSA